MKIFDAHTHIGNISDTEIVSPEEVKTFLATLGVSPGMAMPVALRGGGDNMELHQKLYQEAIAQGFDVALYVNAEMIDNYPDLSSYLNYPFKALKIHPDAVRFSTKQLHTICGTAEKLHLPLMIHTGGNEWSRAGIYETFVRQYPLVTFVLCHARPAEEAFPLLNAYSNVWIDTAFLPFEDLKKRITTDNENRILFGTDYPVNRWHPQLGDETNWYAQQIVNIENCFSERIAQKILCDNYLSLFKKTQPQFLTLKTQKSC